MIRLQPITRAPLQPFVLRESACDYLECRAAGRRCIAADGRAIDLSYQVAYCLGDRHAACPHYARAHGEKPRQTTRRALYAAGVMLMFGLILVALAQAAGTSTPVELARVVGLS